MIELDDEDLDEIPVDTSFLLSGGDLVGPVEECDPLMINCNGVPVPDPLDCPPTTTTTTTSSTHLPMKTQKAARETRRTTTNIFAPQPKRFLSITSTSENPTTSLLTSSSSSSQVPVEKTITTAAGSTPNSLGTFKAMTYSEFYKNMEKNIRDIVKESIELFDRNPREYHPFYLRIFKFVTIGQQLGYIAMDDACVNRIWMGFFKFANSQYEASRKKSISFTGEKSPYATYILTKKLVINGKVITEQRNESEIQRKIKETEAKAKKIRTEWDARASHGEKIGDDLKARLKLFKECMTFTHPAECVKMNKLWTKFLSEEGFSDCIFENRSLIAAHSTTRSHITSTRPAPSPATKVKTESSIPVVTILSDDEVEDIKHSHHNEISNWGRITKPSKTFIVNVIVTSTPSSAACTTTTTPSFPTVLRTSSSADKSSPSFPGSDSPQQHQTSSTPKQSKLTTIDNPERKTRKVPRRRKIVRRNSALGPKNVTAKQWKPLRTIKMLQKTRSMLFNSLVVHKATKEKQVLQQVQLDKMISATSFSSLVEKRRN